MKMDSATTQNDIARHQQTMPAGLTSYGIVVLQFLTINVRIDHVTISTVQAPPARAPQAADCQSMVAAQAE